MSRNVLVTGGAGYIGSHTVRFLIKEGYNVVIYDNLSNGHEFAVKGLNLVNGDIGNYDLLKKTLIDFKIDAIIHFAAFTYVGESVSDPRKYYDNNVLKGMALLNAMIDAGVKNIVFSSSCATYGIPTKVPINENEKQKPINPYGWTKLIFERMMRDYDRAYGLRSVCLRYFNAAGADADGEIGERHDPETHVIPLLLQTASGQRKSFSVFGTDYDTKDGSCVRDYVHVTDLADAHVKAIEYLFKNDRSNCFNLGTGEGVTVLELIKVVEEVTGNKLNIVLDERRPGDPDMLVADNQKALSVLKWNPTHSSIENIVRTAWEWHKRDSQ